VFDAVKTAQPVANRLFAPIIYGAVQFSSVTGGDDHCLMDTLATSQVAQCSGNDIWPEGEALTHFDRGRLVIEPDNQQFHVQTVS